MNATTLILDFGKLSLLIFLGYLLRTKVKFLQRLFIPSSLTAGLLGLLAGPYVLGQFCPYYLTFSDFMKTTSLPLLACCFCTLLFLNKMDTNAFKKATQTYVLLAVIILYQVVLGILLVRWIMPELNDGYGLMPFASFLGGPGVGALPAGIIGDLDNFSVSDATSIATTYATISVCTGCIFGMLWVNIARRKGILTTTSDLRAVPQEEYTGVVPLEKRVPCGFDVTNGNSTGHYTLQWSICGLLLLAGYGIMKLLQLIPGMSGTGISIAVLAGIPLSFVFKKLKLVDLVDKKTLAGFSNIALEYLITYTIASTNLTVFSTHGKLILITTIVMLVVNVIFIFGLGKLWFKDHWFENSICCYGLGNGVMATGLLLLNSADPKNNTGVLINFSSAVALMMITTQTFFLFFVPLWITTNGTMVLICSAVALVVCVILGFVISGRTKSST